jgi:ribonuclease R
MADDYYRFHEQQHLLRGENTKRVFRLGDKVSVQVVRVDMERRQVDLGLVDILETMRSEERRPRATVRSKVKPKAERRKAQRPGRRARAARKGGRRR